MRATAIVENIKIFKNQKINLVLILGASAIVDIRDKIPKVILLMMEK